MLFGFLLVLTLALSLAGFFRKDIGIPFGISGAGFLISLILFYFSWKMSKEVNDLLGGRTMIAHWQYAPDEWALYAASENARPGKSKSGGLFGAFLTVLVIVGLIYYFFYGIRFELRALPFFIGVAIIALALTGYQQWQHNQESGVNAGQSDDVPQAYISTKGVWINKRYFSFSGQISFNVSYESGDPSLIHFDWQTRSVSRSGTIIHYHKLRLPVPRNQTAELDKVLKPYGYHAQ